MADQPDPPGCEPQAPPAPDAVLLADPVPKPCTPQAEYLKAIDRARKAVAITMAVFGLGFGICSIRHEHLMQAAWREPGIWASGAKAFGIGVLACFAAVFALVLEHLARPAEPKPFALRSLFARFLLIVMAVVATCTAMAFAYGPFQAVSAVIGFLLLVAAVRERDELRIVLGALAAIMLGMTVLSTRTAYQYARWHADEIVAAGCELADQCRRTDDNRYNLHPGSDPNGKDALFGQRIDPSDPRVPGVLRKLGAQRIWVDEERVAVYVGEGTEFQIYRATHPRRTSGPVWGFRGKGSTNTPITDRLTAALD